MITDFVVVVPGIMGSTLSKNDRLVWAPSKGAAMRALATFFSSIRGLELAEGIGDNAADDGVEPVALMPDLHVLPGIWTPVKGYDVLLERLARIGCRPVTQAVNDPPGNLLPFPYDWRLSNRYNAGLLADAVESGLARWRDQGGRFADAEVVLVCHSMGGLVARWYVEKEGGAEVTRKLITLGTPFRGAMKALDQLSNGVPSRLGPLSPKLEEFARSLPSLHQLLPSYACIEAGAELQHLALHDIPDVNRAMRDDGLRFHEDLERAEEARPGSSDLRHAIVGTNQTTATTARFTSAGKVATSDTYQTSDLRGDGTVPLVASPKGLPLDHNTLRRVADKHGNLQRNLAALDEVEGVMTATPLIPKATELVPLRVDAPELLMRGEPLAVHVEQEGREGLLVTLRDETGGVDVRVLRMRRGEGVATFDDLTPGAYSVEVTGRDPAAATQPVVSNLLVWSEEELARQGLVPS